MILWLCLALLLCCSGIVSASETALFGVSRQTLHEFARSNHPLQQSAYRLMRRPGVVLMTVLIANTAINVAVFSLSFVAMKHIRTTHPGLAAAGSVAVLVAVLVFGEVAPKTVALSNAARFAPAAAALITMLEVGLAPVRYVLRRLLVNPILRLVGPSVAPPGEVTPHELRLLVEHSAREGVIDSREQEMLQGVVVAGRLAVREVMTPRVDIRSVRLGASRESVIASMRHVGCRKTLVHGRDLDDIRGLVYARDILLHPHPTWKGLIRPVRFVPEQAHIFQVLRGFHETDRHFAVVVDEYGGTAGFVSVEDMLKGIIGHVPDEDETAAPPTTEMIDRNTFRVPGRLSARLWAGRFSVSEVDPHIDTVGGLVVAKLGRLPRSGDSIRIGNLVLTVEQVRNRRIDRILLRREVDVEEARERHA